MSEPRHTPEDQVFQTYYGDNEQYMEDQWNWFIWRKIKDFDLSHVVDLACGYGRNTVKLLPHAGHVSLVDVNPDAIAKCRERFAAAGDKVSYHLTEGKELVGIADASVTAIYSWDAMVHFEQEVMDAYAREFARVLKPGGQGFIHHSNYGAIGAPRHWQDNPSWRSNTSAASVAAALAAAGLEVIDQELQSWNWVDDLDCKTRFRKSAGIPN